MVGFGIVVFLLIGIGWMWWCGYLTDKEIKKNPQIPDKNDILKWVYGNKLTKPYGMIDFISNFNVMPWDAEKIITQLQSEDLIQFVDGEFLHKTPFGQRYYEVYIFNEEKK